MQLCAARLAGGGDGAADGPAAAVEEAAYQKFLALRGLPVVQTSLLLMVLNSLGTAVRLGLPLLDARFARVRSRGLAALPVLHSLDGQPPLLPSDLPEEVLRRFAALLFPAIACVRLPAHVAAFYVTTSPAWRPWYTQNHEWLWPAILLVETLVAGTYLETVIWVLLRRVVVWPAAMLLTGLVGDLIGHRIWVRACRRGGVGGCAAALSWRCHSASPSILTHRHRPAPHPGQFMRVVPYLLIFTLRAASLNTVWFTLPWTTLFSRHLWHYPLQLACHLLMILNARRSDRQLRQEYRRRQLLRRSR